MVCHLTLGLETYSINFQSFSTCVNGINVLMNISTSCSILEKVTSKSSFLEVPVAAKLGIN